uniref:Uncharacterized protein n=1 Tax=Arundo donax TaxID=35708 RepID=A0A0A8YCF8_ARUDO
MYISKYLFAKKVAAYSCQFVLDFLNRIIYLFFVHFSFWTNYVYSYCW